MIELQGGVVIVTGSSRGIGEATARLLATRGANVVINCTSSLEAAEAVAEACRADGGGAIVCQANVAEDADCRKLAQAALDEWGRIDGLVNNAGTTKFCAHGDLDGLAAEDFHAIFAVNTIGPFQMIRAVAPAMKSQGNGAVVNVSSVAGIQGVGSSLAYVASKAGLNIRGIG
ncbi:MAG: SDR family oxidoreductase, partial [Gemmatimonadetes bacterium]|nr:SDR family oxidoreductase [Gemmatimonadota bacterium]